MLLKDTGLKDNLALAVEIEDKECASEWRGKIGQALLEQGEESQHLSPIAKKHLEVEMTLGQLPASPLLMR